MSYVLPHEQPGMTFIKVPSELFGRFNKSGVLVFWEWCQQQFGPPTNCRYGQPATEFYWGVVPGPGYTMFFADPKQATLFALRWA
jgi:hypothetical protein